MYNDLHLVTLPELRGNRLITTKMLDTILKHRENNPSIEYNEHRLSFENEKLSEYFRKNHGFDIKYEKNPDYEAMLSCGFDDANEFIYCGYKKLTV